MATIRKRTWRTKGGERTAWICDYADQDGTRRLKTFSTKKSADAWLAAWLPGTEGDGLADVLFGDYAPTGKLSHSWCVSMPRPPIR